MSTAEPVTAAPLPVIQSLWVGTELSQLEQLAVSSFLYNGHAFHLYVYNDVSNVPAGAEIKDANEILDESLIFKYIDRDTYSGFANLFRYKLLHDRGGFWVDMDMICLRPFNSTAPYVFNMEGNNTIGNCVIKTPIESPIMSYCYEMLISRGDLTLTKWGETGPAFLREAVHKFGLQHYAVAPEVFCPVPYWEAEKLLTESSNELLSAVKSKVRGIHLWNEVWRCCDMDKNANYPEDCIYEELKTLLLNETI